MQNNDLRFQHTMSGYAILIFLISAALLGRTAVAYQQPENQPEGPPLSPEQAIPSFEIAASLRLDLLLSEPQIRQPLSTSFDARGRLWVVQYLQYPEPAGIKMVSRDNFWRIVYDRMPGPPGKDVPGADRISVFEPNPEGGFSFIKDFVSNLNIATAATPTHDGVWVLNPPYLVFYPDQDQDLVPDGEPEIHLEGFGLEDTHSVVNSLCMGPDGWLYAAQGSTVSGSVKRYNSQEKPIKSMGQLIWRYHPKKRIYEIFAEGGGNAFGVAMDDSGRLYSGHNGGDTRGFHYVQGGYFRKGFGKHGDLSNAFSFGYLPPMQHPPIQRFTHTMLACESTALAEHYTGSLLSVDPLHGTLIDSHLIPTESTFKTEDRDVVIRTSDKWFRPVAISDGPDGAAYICDWYDSQVAHLYAHVGKLDRDHGRVYRLTAASANAPEWNVQQACGTDIESAKWLLERLSHPYRWQRWKAIELLSEHPQRSNVFESIVRLLEQPNSSSLDALWTLDRCGWLSDGSLQSDDSLRYPIHNVLAHSMPHVRLWGIRLACDDGALDHATVTSMETTIRVEKHPEVLVQLAASIRRLESSQAIGLAQQLICVNSDNKDPRFRDMIWWMIEKHSDSHALIRNRILENENIWNSELFYDFLLSRLIHKWCLQKSEMNWAMAEQTMQLAGQLQAPVRGVAVKSCIDGFEAAFAGRSLAGTPDSIVSTLATLGQPSLALRLRQGNPESLRDLEALLEKVRVSNSPVGLLEQVAQAISILGEVPQPNAMKLLEPVALDSEMDAQIRRAAIRSLASYRELSIAVPLLDQWNVMSREIQVETSVLLASRQASSGHLIRYLESGKVPIESVPLECIRTMRLHDNVMLQSQLDRFFPDSASLDLSRAQQVVTTVLDRIESTAGDPYRGKKLYKLHCGRCHRLFGTGESIGPELTGYQRDNLRALALNIVAPSLEIREGYQTYALQTEDEQMMTGFLESQTEDQWILRGIDGASHVFPKAEVTTMKAQAESLMPQGILDPLSDQELADLFAYVRSSQPLGD